MLRVYLCIAGLIVQFGFSQVYGHEVDPQAHQWIAAKGLQILAPGPMKQELGDYLGDWLRPPHSACERLFCPGLVICCSADQRRTVGLDYQQGTFVVEGAEEADIWSIANAFPHLPAARDVQGLLPSYWGHFWDPDLGHDAGLSFLGVRYPSAFEKADVTWAYALARYSWWQAVGSESGREQAYYWLGHVVHLLTDLGCPSHVLNDVHPSKEVRIVGDMGIEFEIIWGDDEYHQFVAGNLSELEATIIGLWPRSASGLPLNPPGCGGNYEASLPAEFRTDLFRLFVDLAERADNFDSDDIMADDDDAIDDVPPAAPGQFNGGQNYDNGEGDIAEAGCRTIASYLIPETVESVAGLYELFWNTTHPAPPVMRPELTEPFEGEVIIYWDAPTDLPSDVEINGYNVYRGTSSSGPYAYLGTTQQHTYDDRPPSDTTTYYYTVATTVRVRGTSTTFEGPKANAIPGSAEPQSQDLAVTPTSIDFGTLPVGTTDSDVVRVCNMADRTTPWQAYEIPANYPWLTVSPNTGELSVGLTCPHFMYQPL